MIPHPSDEAVFKAAQVLADYCDTTEECGVCPIASMCMYGKIDDSESLASVMNELQDCIKHGGRA